MNKYTICKNDDNKRHDFAKRTMKDYRFSLKNQQLIATILLCYSQFHFCYSFSTYHATTPQCISKLEVSLHNKIYHKSRIPARHRLFSSPPSSESETSSSRTWIDNFGSSALVNVENLAQVVTRANDDASTSSPISTGENSEVEGSIVNLEDASYNIGIQRTPIPSSGGSDNSNKDIGGSNRNIAITGALKTLERDMQLLDNFIVEKPLLSKLEISLLASSVILAGSGPLISADPSKITEVLAPACAAFSAAIGIGAEYTGKVAVADGKEVAATTLQCAAEAEMFLAKAERVKAVTPLCVGISATAATLSLVAPVLIETLVGEYGSKTRFFSSELYLISPLLSVLSAAVASLSFQETKLMTSRAISVGNRRFAGSGIVGRTWLSATEQIQNASDKTTDKWRSFSWSVLPAPIIGSIIPGINISTKAVIVSALAAAQCAFFLAQAENVLARGTDAVALKSRSAAVCDTYANQGARSAAILPFTSALSSLCAAATAAIVELPFLEFLVKSNSFGGTTSSIFLVGFFPALGSLFAAAASVSKARCEVDAEAATIAASTLAVEYDDQDDPVLRPFRGVLELIRLTLGTTWKSFKRSKFYTRIGIMKKFLFFWQNSKKNEEEVNER